MRIHLPLPPSLFQPPPATGPSDPPLLRIGGDLVLMELQGELSFEGDCAGNVVGVLGLERMDKPTLHLGPHHLLHGRLSQLPRPLAVIRRTFHHSHPSNIALNDDAEESLEIDDAAPEMPIDRTPSKASPSSSSGKLMVPSQSVPHVTPSKPSAIPAHLQSSPAPHPSSSPYSSSPVGPPPIGRDYSSDLDSSPIRPGERVGRKRKHDGEDGGRMKMPIGEDREGEGRTREYEVVGVVRKKVVFSLRPEPIVTATVLPE